MATKPDRAKETEPTRYETSPETAPDEPDDSEWSKRDRLVAGVKQGIESVAMAGLVSAGVYAAPAAAQVGDGVCGSPLAETVNSAVPLVIGILMVLGAVLTYVLHNYSGLKRDPQAIQDIKDWRNRAGMTTVTTPILAWAIVEFVGFTGVQFAECISISPF